MISPLIPIVLLLFTTPALATFSQPDSSNLTEPTPSIPDATILYLPSALEITANKTFLPNKLTIYFDGKSVVNRKVNDPTKKFQELTLPTNNDVGDMPGCYIACYSRNNTAAAIYSVSSDAYVYGQIRVSGEYKGRICKPTGYSEDTDISTVSNFKLLCAAKFDACKLNACWAGGDTGGWYGIQ